jgi:pilus assembly protein FimV
MGAAHPRKVGLVRIRLLIGSLLLCIPILAQALGLGRLVVHSGLDEPLNGEVELFSATAQETKTLRAALASRAEFEAAGIERLPHLTTIKFNVRERPDGRYFLLLTTDQPLREPFLHLLLQVEWSGGRVIREYTALLDPPHWVAGKPGAIEAPQPLAAPPEAKPLEPPPTPPPAAATEASPAPPPLPGERPATAQAPLLEDQLLGPPHVDGGEARESAAPPAEAEDGKPATAAADWANVAEYGPVKPGETAGGIVGKIRVDRSVSTEQATLALLKTNPRAFYGSNVNHLRVGQILRVPAREAVEAVSRPQAVKELRAQYDAWQEYKLKLLGSARAPAVAAAPAARETAPTKPKTEPPAAAAKDKEKAKAAPKESVEAAKDISPDELLKIVRATLDEKGKAEGSGVTTEAPAKVAGEQRQLRDKVATLEEALESKQMENKELRERMTALQQQVENTKRLIEIQNRELALAQKRETPETKPAEPAPKPAAPAKPAARESASTAPSGPGAPAPKPPPVAESAPLFEGVLDDILANPVTLGLLGAVVVLGGIILFLYVRRRTHAKSEFAESILSTGGTVVGPATATGLAARTATADASFLSDFSKGGMGNIQHTDEVDPIAEAEVYLAYGRDEQAEEILKEAMVKDPARHELKLKLLEIYHQRNDLAAFETLAEELYAAIEGKGGPLWDKVEEMGRKLNPNNPMFRGGRPAPAAAVAAAPLAAAPAAVAASMAAPSGEIHLDLGTPPAPKPPSPPPLVAGDLDLELSVAETGAPAASAVIDFESPFKPETAAVPAARPEGLAAGAAPGLDLGIPFEPGAAAAPAEPKGPPDWDETATKLDLAKAYIDMGDADGARSILNEVMAEGTELQKKQARELTAQIS